MDKPLCVTQTYTTYFLTSQFTREPIAPKKLNPWNWLPNFDENLIYFKNSFTTIKKIKCRTKLGDGKYYAIFVGNVILFPVIKDFYTLLRFENMSSGQSSVANFKGAVLFGPLCILLGNGGTRLYEQLAQDCTRNAAAGNRTRDPLTADSVS